jgi:hypothetical protein
MPLKPNHKSLIARKNSMNNLVAKGSYNYKTVKHLSEHTGLTQAQVKAHLKHLRDINKVPRNSPFY